MKRQTDRRTVAHSRSFRSTKRGQTPRSVSLKVELLESRLALSVGPFQPDVIELNLFAPEEFEAIARLIAPEHETLAQEAAAFPIAYDQATTAADSADSMNPTQSDGFILFDANTPEGGRIWFAASGPAIEADSETFSTVVDGSDSVVSELLASWRQTDSRIGAGNDWWDSLSFLPLPIGSEGEGLFSDLGSFAILSFSENPISSSLSFDGMIDHPEFFSQDDWISIIDPGMQSSSFTNPSLDNLTWADLAGDTAGTGAVKISGLNGDPLFCHYGEDLLFSTFLLRKNGLTPIDMVEQGPLSAPRGGPFPAIVAGQQSEARGSSNEAVLAPVTSNLFGEDAAASNTHEADLDYSERNGEAAFSMNEPTVSRNLRGTGEEDSYLIESQEGEITAQVGSFEDSGDVSLSLESLEGEVQQGGFIDITLAMTDAIVPAETLVTQVEPSAANPAEQKEIAIEAACDRDYAFELAMADGFSQMIDEAGIVELPSLDSWSEGEGGAEATVAPTPVSLPAGSQSGESSASERTKQAGHRDLSQNQREDWAAGAFSTVIVGAAAFRVWQKRPKEES